MLINKYLPAYQFSEFHSVSVHGFFNGIYQVMLQTDFSTNTLIKLLFRLRGMPTESFTIERLTELGFIKLHEEPGKEIIYGMVTDSPMFNTCQPISSPIEFIQDSDPAIIKAVINFKLQEVSNSRHIISTETRIWCGSKAMKSKFKYYWFFVKPFSQLIRKSMLRQLTHQILESNIKNT